MPPAITRRVPPLRLLDQELCALAEVLCFGSLSKRGDSPNDELLPEKFPCNFSGVLKTQLRQQVVDLN